MERQFNNDQNQDFTSLLKLLLEQQRAIKELLQDATRDIEHLKQRYEDIGILKNRIEVLEKEINNCKIMREGCQSKIERTFGEILQKREGINTRISNLETELNNKLYDLNEKLRSELENKLESKVRSANDSIKDIQNNQIKQLQEDVKKLTGEAGKYGGLIAFIVSILLYLLKTIYDNIIIK